ncbi:MAG: ABC-2 family transporter protein [Candidatus Bipolaricaulota bacterium]|nr:ABC-2 family transporter protein [Candidatus Bipolaricaulota bacterium]MDW8329872.1 ABC-2 family transporter protein [Candidatus Bipolaricaulota bacterium]
MLALYFVLVSAQLRAQMQYKFSFLADFLATFIGMGLEFAGVLVLFRHMPVLGGWTLPEVMLLYGTAEFSFALANMIAEGFDSLSNVIRLGEFDRFLVRPRGVFFQVLASEFSLRRLGRVAQGMLVLGAGLWLLKVEWGLERWLFLGWTVLGGMVFFIGLFVIGATFAFWTIEGLEAINIFTHGGVTMASYPIHIFAEWLRNFFVFVLPLAFVNFYPMLFLLEKPDPFGLPSVMPFLAFPLCSLVLLVGIAFWRVGVRHYQSTGH